MVAASTPVAAPTPYSKLLKARLPLYLRFLVITALLVGAAGGGGLLATRACRIALFLVLFRRFLRCQCGLPSKKCTAFGGRAIEPSMPGLHRRVLELYGGPDCERGLASPEATLDGMQRRMKMPDGQEIAYWDVGDKKSDHVVLLCNGLGARMAGWAPLLDCLHGASSDWSKRRLVVPEYRGQFKSMPLVGAGVSVEQGARDLSELAKALRLKRVTLLCWSTGVQVGLQLALDRPDMVEAMVLIQGTNGEALTCLGQPLCPVPGMPSFLAWFLAAVPPFFVRNGRRAALSGFLVRHTAAIEKVGRGLVWVFGSDFMPAIVVRYVQDMMQSDAHFTQYCAYAEALGRNVLMPRLPEIQAPAFVVTGTPDFVTPARCSYDLSAALGGRVELLDDVSGSHYYIFEEPHKLAKAIVEFLEQAAPVGNPALFQGQR